MKNLPTLPTSDNEYWEYSDKETIPLDQIKDILCKRHKLVINQAERECFCDVCNFGFVLQVDKIELGEGIIKYLHKGKWKEADIVSLN